jgi:hypothetical protein
MPVAPAHGMPVVACHRFSAFSKTIFHWPNAAWLALTPLFELAAFDQPLFFRF